MSAYNDCLLLSTWISIFSDEQVDAYLRIDLTDVTRAHSVPEAFQYMEVIDITPGIIKSIHVNCDEGMIEVSYGYDEEDDMVVPIEAIVCIGDLYDINTIQITGSTELSEEVNTVEKMVDIFKERTFDLCPVEEYNIGCFEQNDKPLKQKPFLKIIKED
jgi:hypothetical protein